MTPEKGKKYAISFICPAWGDHFKGVLVCNGEVEPNEGWFGFDLEGQDKAWFSEDDILGEIKE